MYQKTWNKAKKIWLTFIGEKETQGTFKKGSQTALANIFLRGFEWYFLMPIAFAIVAALKELGVNIFLIIVLLSSLTALLSFFMIYINDRSTIDITLMEGTGRLFNLKKQVLSRKEKLTKYTLLLLIVLWDLFYQGPAYVFLLLRSISPTIEKRKISLILIMSFTQMTPWTILYLLGYESLKKFLL